MQTDTMHNEIFMEKEKLVIQSSKSSAASKLFASLVALLVALN